MGEPIHEELASLAEWYTIEDRDTVAAFLAKHPDFVSALEETVPYVEKHFPGVKRTLAVEMDEDDEPGGESIERLYLLIAVPKDMQDPMTRMDRLDEEWAYELCDSTGELVVIDLDFT